MVGHSQGGYVYLIIIIGALTKSRQHSSCKFSMGGSGLVVYASDRSNGVAFRSQHYILIHMGLGGGADLPRNIILFCIIGIYKYIHKHTNQFKAAAKFLPIKIWISNYF